MVDLAGHGRFLRADFDTFQELYVDPRSGLIRLNKHYRSWRRHAEEDRKRKAAEIDSRRRVVNEKTLFIRLEDIWYRVEVGGLPKVRLIEDVIDGKKRAVALARNGDTM